MIGSEFTYRAGMARVGEDTPQSRPELFTDKECAAEVKYLLRLNKRYGTHVLRVAAYLRIVTFQRQREDVRVQVESAFASSAQKHGRTDEGRNATDYDFEGLVRDMIVKFPALIGDNPTMRVADISASAFFRLLKANATQVTV